jgi:hypothetical protein
MREEVLMKSLFYRFSQYSVIFHRKFYNSWHILAKTARKDPCSGHRYLLAHCPHHQIDGRFEFSMLEYIYICIPLLRACLTRASIEGRFLWLMAVNYKNRPRRWIPFAQNVDPLTRCLQARALRCSAVEDPHRTSHVSLQVLQVLQHSPHTNRYTTLRWCKRI